MHLSQFKKIQTWNKKDINLCIDETIDETPDVPEI